ncbi:hypothetical protein B0J18DRAFT_402649 [Chaetomium sp. MPI-SDFR-AT-0129]|nr:hypothetical protein B0J18DRAFT_402649 [Chaetomium sp. MPI-SDFR-AT-0129]
MLSARITAFRWAEGSRALIYSRLNHARISARWQSAGRNAGKFAAAPGFRQSRKSEQSEHSSLDDRSSTDDANWLRPLDTGDKGWNGGGGTELGGGSFPRDPNATLVAQDACDKPHEAAGEAAKTAREHMPESPTTFVVFDGEEGSQWGNPQVDTQIRWDQEPEPIPSHVSHKLDKFPFLEIPTDPEQLKALPKGFHQTSPREQQDELWVVQAEEHLGTDWDLENPGKHRPYSHPYPPYSPSKVLGMLHRWQRVPWTPQQWRLARAIAGNRTSRLPVLTAQAFLRRQVLLARRSGGTMKMERYLGSTEEWKARLAKIEEQTGTTEADIKQWLWILSAPGGDEKIRRFLSSECRKPLFLLQVLLAKDKTIREPESFLGLLHFARENYVLAKRPQDELQHQTFRDAGRSMTWWHYVMFLYRFVRQFQSSWPVAMPLLARLTADYINTIPLSDTSRVFTGFQARSFILNRALVYFSWPVRTRPIDQMEHNWAAQRHLLRLAATTEPPLVITREGYRAVRTVLVTLRKTRVEAKNVSRAAETWPPYRRPLDGLDERRDPEDDLTRSARAGILARASGYGDDMVDRALSTLGGSTLGQAPTIPTRALLHPAWSGRLASRTVYSEWAVQVTATRNAREAWIVFENPPAPGLRPTAEIYGQMFEKLYARPASELDRPGDVKEAFPVRNGNLSEFEIARLTPPTPEDLYDRMLSQDNIKPTGYCLTVLIRHASSKEAALRYLDDSPYQHLIGSLKAPVSAADPAGLKALSELPLNIFHAWISLLCRIHDEVPGKSMAIHRSAVESPNANDNTSADGKRREGPGIASPLGLSFLGPHSGDIGEAIMLASKFQHHNRKAAHHDSVPWRTIMRALCGRKLLFSRTGPDFKILETLMTFLKIFELTTASKGVDPVNFELLCIMIRKVLKMTTFDKTQDGSIALRATMPVGAELIEKMVLRGHAHATRTFQTLTVPVPAQLRDRPLGRGDYSDGDEEEKRTAHEKIVADSGVTSGMPRYNVVGRTLHLYMMTLACCGDAAEMVRLMDWLLDGWGQESIHEGAKSPHGIEYRYTIRTIAYFAQAGRELVDPAEMTRLRWRLDDMRASQGCTWFWELGQEQGQEQGQDLVEEARHRDSDDMASSLSVEFAVRPSQNVVVDIPRFALVHPKSQYLGYTPPLQRTKERHAVAPLLDAMTVGAREQEYAEFELDEFSFYINSANYPWEMRPLQHLTTRAGHDKLFFDGVLRAGEAKHYVQHVEVTALPIGNYGKSHASTRDRIWVRSRYNSGKEIYYRLNKPSPEYARFYTPFLWVADLGKHVVDFTAAMTEQGRGVEISSFRGTFVQWLVQMHGASPEFQSWRAQHPSDDYRTSSEACFLPLATIDRIKVGDTISTPRDGETTGTKWRSMVSKGAADDGLWFGLVQQVHADPRTGSRSFNVIWLYRPAETPCGMMRYLWPNELFLSDHCNCEGGRVARVQEHDILGTHEIDWRSEAAQHAGPGGRGGQRLFVRQTYMTETRRWVTLRESHMTCAHTRPAKENPGFRAGDTVLATLSVPSSSSSSSSPSFSSVTSSASLFQAHTEPYEVVKIFKQGNNMFVRLRRLLRRAQVDSSRSGTTPPNELVYTDQLVVAKANKVVDKCVVRFFRAGETIPTPYDRGGTGNLFYITHRLETTVTTTTATTTVTSRCVPFEGDFPSSLRQGFDPQAPPTFRKLRGMDLFCGSGNFGRGLEEGGAIEMHWANDIWDRAIHTYMANSPGSSTQPCLGSVDDLLWLALEGQYAGNVPRPGEVDFISAGSPCPGFSLLTQDKTTLAQVKNQSLVASFASFVDLYRPLYGILENVATIVQTRENRAEDVLSQLFCAIVGLGYQAQLVLGDAWSHGAPQSRTRVFLYFAAPCLRLPDAPPLSHSHYADVKGRGLGEISNGEPFVRRSFAPTPFSYVSAATATADLPALGDGKPDSVPAFPDHRVGAGVTSRLRYQIASIPTHPHGMSFAKAWYGHSRNGIGTGAGTTAGKGVMTTAERTMFPDTGPRVAPISKAWRRARPTDVFQTITTRNQPTDARAGSALHWSDDRPLTVLESRRAQGFPDEEVLLGSLADQWKLVGNSVARQMALALGLKFREAWAGGLGESDRASVSSMAGSDWDRDTAGRSVSVVSSTPFPSSFVPAVPAAPATPTDGIGYAYHPDLPREFMDLTGDTDESPELEPATSTIVTTRSDTQPPTVPEIVDLTADNSDSDIFTPHGPSKNLYAEYNTMSEADSSTTASAGQDSTIPSRKRPSLPLVEAGPDLEVRPAKNARLELPSEPSSPDLGPGLGVDSFQQTARPAREEDDGGRVAVEGRGPTVVRLATPDDWDDDGEGGYGQAG